MLTDLEIPLVPNMLAERSSGWVAVYPRNTGDADQIAFATLKALVAHPDLFAEALYRHECDELLDVAEAVARVRTISREMDDDEALPELTKMRDPRQPEWLRTLAGREMARRGGALRDQIAVHDASSVDEPWKGGDPLPVGYEFPKCHSCGCGIWPDGTGHHSAACVDASSVDEDHFQGHVAVNFPPSGCLACAFTHGCRDAKGMMCTPSERKDSRRIVWQRP